jgi:nucleotide-binding universal stress UspA family protein
MANPLRSEGEAFRFLLAALVYFGLIAIAGVINAWAGLVVFIALTIVAGWWWWRSREPAQPRQVGAGRATSPDENRILVIANETVGGAPLLDKLKQLASSSDATAKVHVVSPALNSPLRHLASDEDPARAAAQERLERSLGKLRDEGIEASGEVGDGDPLQAIEDALRTFGADQIVISTHPEGRSNWLERGLVTQARERFTVPVDHVVVDLSDRP